MKTIAFILAVGLLIPVAALAQTQPAAAPVEHLKAKVTATKGNVFVQMDDGQPKQSVKVGMELPENATLFTMPNAMVQFAYPPDQVITVDHTSQVKIVQAELVGGKLNTLIGMKYGATRYQVEAAGREHEAVIASPSQTLSVRGTDFLSVDRPGIAAYAVSNYGRVQRNNGRKKTYFGSKGGGKAEIKSNTENAAQTALNKTVVDPSIALARSQAENAIVESLLSRGANVTFDFNRGIRIVRGGTVPLTDKELTPFLPGQLNFVLRWTSNSNVNLGVTEPGNAPGNKTLYPMGGFNKLPDGGQIFFDHQGGPHGGFEVASWPRNSFPDGRFLVQAQLISGPDAPATLDVFQDGVRLPIRTGQGEVTTANFTVVKVNPEIANAFAIGSVLVQPTAAKIATAKIATPTKAAVVMGPLPNVAAKTTPVVKTAKSAKKR